MARGGVVDRIQQAYRRACHHHHGVGGAHNRLQNRAHRLGRAGHYRMQSRYHRHAQMLQKLQHMRAHLAAEDAVLVLQAHHAHIGTVQQACSLDVVVYRFTAQLIHHAGIGMLDARLVVCRDHYAIPVVPFHRMQHILREGRQSALRGRIGTHERDLRSVVAQTIS
jgi:hypothetical protein